MTCRHGFTKRGTCLAPACELASRGRAPLPPSPPSSSTSRPTPTPRKANGGRHTKHPTDRLTAEEAAQARELVRKFGPEAAAKRLGISDTTTLYKALAQVDVSRLTAFVIRSHLDRRVP